MARLNYSSLVVDNELAEEFDVALSAARSNVDPVKHWINGRWVSEGIVRERMDPCDARRVSARYHDGSTILIRRAVDAARAASPAWRSLSYQSRCELLRKAKQKFVDQQAELGGIASAETGKIRIESLAEMAEAVDLIEYYASEIERNNGYVAELSPGVDETRTDVLRPYGVFGIISPFNFPVALAVNMTSAALLTGNTVVLKPSDKTPRSTTAAMMLIAAGLPTGALNIVQGGSDIGAVLVRSEVDGIAFTGSARVGWSIINELQSSKRKKPVLAEMGGQNPAIVSATADIDSAATGIIRSAFGLSGQKCSSCRRVIVERSVAGALNAKLVKAAEALKVGDPSDSSSHLGPVIDDAIAERVDLAIAAAHRDGSVLTGGRLEGATGHYFRPTIVTDLPSGHPLTRDELFAPFLTITAVDNFDDAMKEANAVEYGLSAGVYTADEKQKQQFLDEIEAGVVYVNRSAGATTGAWPGAQPFCGWKSSGSSGKGGLGPWYLSGFMREQSRTIAECV